MGVSGLLRVVAAGLVVGMLGACSARKTYPDPAAGWHNSGYTVLFGRLQRIPSGNPDVPPAWTVRFGGPDETYNGEFALTPPDRLTGFEGGETVEVRGRLLDQPTNDQYNGRWYVAESIRLWRAHN